MSIRGIVRQQNKSFHSTIAMLICTHSRKSQLASIQHTAYIAGREGGEMDGEQGSGLIQKKYTPFVLGTPKPANCYKM